MAVLHPSQFASKYAIYAGFKEFDRMYPNGVEVTAETLGKLSLMALEWLASRVANLEGTDLRTEYDTEVRLIRAASRKHLAESYDLFRKESKTVGDDEARMLLTARDSQSEENDKLFIEMAQSNYKNSIIGLVVEASLVSN